MKEISCDIAKDLMIPYLDGICSDEGRNLVDRHLEQCSECRAFLESISSKETCREQHELKHLKKMNIMMKLRMLMVFFIPFILSVVAYNSNLVKGSIKADGSAIAGADGMLPVQLFYLIEMPVLMLCFAFAFSDIKKLKFSKIKIPALISVSVLLFIILSSNILAKLVIAYAPLAINKSLTFKFSSILPADPILIILSKLNLIVRLIENIILIQKCWKEIF